MSGSYQSASKDASRSPCPMLNTLANNGYLPRDGKNITKAMFVEALQSGVNLEKGLAKSLASAAIEKLSKGRMNGNGEGYIDLSDLREHNVIEHDASLVHGDFDEGDNFTPQPDLVKRLQSYAGDKNYIGLSDLAIYRVERERECFHKHPQTYTLSGKVIPAYSEATVFWYLFGTRQSDGKWGPSLNAIEQFMLHEKFPDNFVKATRPVGLMQLAPYLLSLFASSYYHKLMGSKTKYGKQP